MAEDRRRLLRSGMLLTAVLGLSIGTFLLLDLLGLQGTDRFLGYLALTTLITAGMIFYVAAVVVGHRRQPIDQE